MEAEEEDEKDEEEEDEDEERKEDEGGDGHRIPSSCPRECAFIHACSFTSISAHETANTYLQERYKKIKTKKFLVLSLYFVRFHIPQE